MRGEKEWDLELRGVRREPGVQGKEDEVIADEEQKVVSSEDGRKVKLA